MKEWLSFISLALAFTTISCQITEGVMPTKVIKCVQINANKQFNDTITYSTSEDIHTNCLQEFLWKSENIRWTEFNITKNDMYFINSLIGSFVRRGRTKRQVGPGGPGGPSGPGGPGGPGGPMRRGRIFPLTGFRVRREYRRLSDRERAAFHAAINQMKMSGQYDTFANLHQGMVVTSAHGGPNFFGWHRVYVALVEEAIRRINRRLSLPYWDSTLDFDMTNPANSIIWSAPFLGNGDGFVTVGPFANWQTPVGRLTRNIGGGSRLFSRPVVRAIMTRCRIREISDPTAQEQFNLELAHGGPHVWVGGQMSGLNTAAHDPVFFLHHAYVDYIWEMFRMRQTRFCGVNPSRDYPPTMGQHSAQRPMDGFPQYRNIDGYRSYWTRFWYRYERSPTCARWRPFCGTPYLRCDVARQRCISVARMAAAQAAGAAGVRAFTAGSPPQTFASSLRGRAQEATVMVGPRFRAPPAEPRTLDANIGRIAGTRMRRSASQTADMRANNLTARANSPADFGQKFTAPPSDGRASDVVGETFAGGVIGFDPITDPMVKDGTVFTVSEPLQLLLSIDYPEPVINDLLRLPAQSSFLLNGQTNINNWAFIPVRVFFSNDRDGIFPNFSKSNNQSPPHARQSPTFKNQRGRCIQDASGAIQVKVQSSGLNYHGTFTENALIDTHLPIDTTVTYIGIKSPKNSTTEAIVTAVHSCGIMCQAHCMIPNSDTVAYKPCNGVLKIDGNDTSLYGNTHKEAVANAWKGKQFTDIMTETVRLTFYCSMSSVSS